jgi:NAD dependent epimerase/dehydratase family enzyme
MGEVCINLAGSPIAQRWTNQLKSSILNSRVQALNVLANAIKEHKIPY